MSTVANIYDNGPISPIVKIKENFSVWTMGTWKHFVVDFIEPMPRSSQMVVDLLATSGATTLAANGTISKQLMNILLLSSGEFLQLRYEPIDDIECVLWEQASQGRNSTRGTHARVTLTTPMRDPYLATSSFYIIGKDLDPQMEIRNPQGVAISSARVVFWGYRYLISSLQNEPANTTRVPAEGR